MAVRANGAAREAAASHQQAADAVHQRCHLTSKRRWSLPKEATFNSGALPSRRRRVLGPGMRLGRPARSRSRHHRSTDHSRIGSRSLQMLHQTAAPSNVSPSVGRQFRLGQFQSNDEAA